MTKTLISDAPVRWNEPIPTTDLSNSAPVKAIHSIGRWLPLTATWLHNQVRCLPDEVENHVVCKRTENLDQFPIPHLYSLEGVSLARRYLQRVTKKLGLSRPYGSHLPLLKEIICKVRPDILHTHFGHMGWVNTPLAKKYGVKHVVSFYGSDVNHIPATDPQWFSRYREMGREVDQVLCEGPHMADSIARLGIPRQKIKVHSLGVDLSMIRFTPRVYRTGETLRFLIVGAFREKKGIPYALEALASFSRVQKDIEITIIGDADESVGEQLEKRNILETIVRCNLWPKVRMLGEQPRDVVLAEAYRHHIFVSPSVTARDADCEGGAPVSIIEMAASGMPVISTTHCDIPFVLSRQNARYLVEERDSDALCDAIQRLLLSNWEDIVVANRKLIEQRLDLKVQSQQLGEIYQGLAGRSFSRGNSAFGALQSSSA